MKKTISLVLATVMVLAVVFSAMPFTVAAADAVAKIGTTEYNTLDDAIKAAYEATADVTITLLKDAAYTSENKATSPTAINNKNGKVVTIDGNGKTLSLTSHNGLIIPGTAVIKNVTLNHMTTGSVFHMHTAHDLTVDNVTINITEQTQYTVINPLATGTFNITLNKVNVAKTVAAGAEDKNVPAILRTGNNTETTDIKFTATDCNFDFSGNKGFTVGLSSNTKLDATFTNCKIESKGNAIAAYVDGDKNCTATINLDNCSIVSDTNPKFPAAVTVNYLSIPETTVTIGNGNPTDMSFDDAMAAAAAATENVVVKLNKNSIMNKRVEFNNNNNVTIDGKLEDGTNAKLAISFDDNVFRLNKNQTYTFQNVDIIVGSLTKSLFQMQGNVDANAEGDAKTTATLNFIDSSITGEFTQNVFNIMGTAAGNIKVVNIKGSTITSTATKGAIVVTGNSAADATGGQSWYHYNHCIITIEDSTITGAAVIKQTKGSSAVITVTGSTLTSTTGTPVVIEGAENIKEGNAGDSVVLTVKNSTLVVPDIHAGETAAAHITAPTSDKVTVTATENVTLAGGDIIPTENDSVTVYKTGTTEIYTANGVKYENVTFLAAVEAANSALIPLTIVLNDNIPDVKAGSVIFRNNFELTIDGGANKYGFFVIAENVNNNGNTFRVGGISVGDSVQNCTVVFQNTKITGEATGGCLFQLFGANNTLTLKNVDIDVTTKWAILNAMGDGFYKQTINCEDVTLKGDITQGSRHAIVTGNGGMFNIITINLKNTVIDSDGGIWVSEDSVGYVTLENTTIIANEYYGITFAERTQGSTLSIDGGSITNAEGNKTTSDGTARPGVRFKDVKCVKYTATNNPVIENFVAPEIPVETTPEATTPEQKPVETTPENKPVETTPSENVETTPVQGGETTTAPVTETKGGCGGIAIAAQLVALICAAAAVIVIKKK